MVAFYEPPFDHGTGHAGPPGTVVVIGLSTSTTAATTSPVFDARPVTPEPTIIRASGPSESDIDRFIREVDKIEERTARSRALSVPSRVEAARRRVDRRPPVARALPPPWPAALRAFC